MVTRIFWRWVPLAGVTTAVCVLVYLLAQQMGRHLADDPQVQMAHEIADALDAGRPVDAVLPPASIDIARSRSPFAVVVDDQGRVVAASGRLDGQARAVPPGVFDAARQRGETRVTWQPERGVRVATVTVLRRGGFVTAGRSLAETETRAAQFGTITLLTWAATLAGVFVLCAASEVALRV